MTSSDPISIEQLLDWAPYASPAALAEFLSRGKYRAEAHHRLLSDLIVRATIHGNVRAIVAMPPRHGKSYMISYWGLVWALEQNPELRVGVLTYEADFAMSWGRRVRDTIIAHQARLAVSVVRDMAAAQRWSTGEGEGGMVTAGVGGPLTGRGLDLCVIDDPVKNAEQARSPTYRNHCWEWWTDTVQTRLEPGASVILVMTRWNEDDLAGRLIREGGWEVISLPALAEDEDPLDRKRGEALWPERYPSDCEKFVEAKRYPRTWAALYQQRPAPEEGNIFKRSHFRYVRDEGPLYVLGLPDGKTRTVVKSACWLAQTADTALEAKKDSDYTAITTWAVCPQPDEGRPPDVILIDVYRERLEVPDQWPTMIAQRQKHHAVNFRWWGVEKKGSGHGLFQIARRAGIPLRELKADTDKVTRAMPLAMGYESGRVYHLHGAPWLEAWESELLGFPNGAHDDQVDAGAHFMREIAEPAAAVFFV